MLFNFLEIQSKRDSNEQGFSLIELLVVLIVAAIIMTIGVPSVMSTIAKNRVTTASNELVTALNLAKSEAIRSNQFVILCKSSNGTQCGDNTVNWSDGWILFYNTDNDNPPNVDAGEKIIRLQAAPHDSLNFIFKTGDFIRFNPNGRSNENGRFCFRNSYDESLSKAVIITQVGRIRTEQRSTSVCET